MPVFPGTMPPIFEDANTIEKDGFRETRLTMYSHTGTHVDAPSHIFRDGRSLHELGISHFVGKGVLVDSGRHEKIDLGILQSRSKLITDSDFVLLHTHWGERWGTDGYFDGHPSLTIAAAKWLSEQNIKGVGIDAISIDPMDSVDLPIHRVLLSKEMIIIENLANLEKIGRETFIFSCAPLRTLDADGSPVRAYATY